MRNNWNSEESDNVWQVKSKATRFENQKNTHLPEDSRTRRNHHENQLDQL